MFVNSFFCGNIIIFFFYIILFGMYIDVCELIVFSGVFCYFSCMKNEDWKRKGKKSVIISIWVRYIYKGLCFDFIYM